MIDKIKTIRIKFLVIPLLITLLAACSSSLDQESLIGTWKIISITEESSDQPSGLWVNKNKVIMSSLLLKDDLWIFKDDLTLKHEGKLAIWPQPRSYQLLGDELFFYLGDIKDNPDHKPLGKLTISSSDNNEFSIKINGRKGDDTRTAVFKRI